MWRKILTIINQNALRLKRAYQQTHTKTGVNMSYIEPEEDGPNYRTYIIIGAVVIAILFLLALNVNAFERDEKAFTAVGSQYKPVSDPIVTVERYEPQDYHNDETILIAGERFKPIVWVSEPKKAPKELINEVLPPTKENTDAKTSCEMYSDDFPNPVSVDCE